MSGVDIFLERSICERTIEWSLFVYDSLSSASLLSASHRQLHGRFFEQDSFLAQTCRRLCGPTGVRQSLFPQLNDNVKVAQHRLEHRHRVCRFASGVRNSSFLLFSTALHDLLCPTISAKPGKSILQQFARKDLMTSCYSSRQKRYCPGTQEIFCIEESPDLRERTAVRDRAVCFVYLK